jgi:hypothetical protein
MAPLQLWLLASLAVGPGAGLRLPELRFQSTYFADAQGGGAAPPTAPNGQPAGSAGSPGSAGSSAGSKDDLDFDLLPAAPKEATQDQKKIASKYHTRRTMLLLHQAFGIATTAGMVGTLVFGQLDYSDKFSGAAQTGQWELWHDYFLSATTVTFVTAGLLALLAPVPFEKKSEGIDSVTVHKWSMLATTLGGVAEIVLGIITVAREGYVNQATLATAHLVVGYASAGCMATGVGALFF